MRIFNIDEHRDLFKDARSYKAFAKSLQVFLDLHDNGVISDGDKVLGLTMSMPGLKKIVDEYKRSIRK